MVSGLFSQAIFKLNSPDKKIQTNIKLGNYVEFEVLYGSDAIIEYSRISMNINEDKILGQAAKIRKKSLDQLIK